jgi:hypothetical protein
MLSKWTTCALCDVLAERKGSQSRAVVPSATRPSARARGCKGAAQMEALVPTVKTGRAPHSHPRGQRGTGYKNIKSSI